MPAGGGAVFDVKVDEEGLYPFVSHAFARRRPRPGRPAQGRQPQGDDVPLSSSKSREPPAGRLPRLRSSGTHRHEQTSQPTLALRGRADRGRRARSRPHRRQPGRRRRRRQAEPGSAAAAREPAATPEPSLFAGIEQQGAALGSPKAPVTLVEYADLQCPYCAQWARDALPTLVEDYVKTGKLRIVFRGLAFIGPDSDKALRTAIAAGEQNHLWDVVHGLYEPGRRERRLGHRRARHRDRRRRPRARRRAAPRRPLGARGRGRSWSAPPRRHRPPASTARRPSRSARPAGTLELVQVSSLGPEGIVPAIEAVLAR